MTTIQDFPWTVIESPRASFKKQCMERMGVLSKELGSAEYDGPQRVCPARWRHISTIYILDPVEIGVYVATSLNDRFHYQVLKSEESVITGDGGEIWVGVGGRTGFAFVGRINLVWVVVAFVMTLDLMAVFEVNLLMGAGGAYGVDPCAFGAEKISSP